MIGKSRIGGIVGDPGGLSLGSDDCCMFFVAQ